MIASDRRAGPGGRTGPRSTGGHRHRPGKIVSVENLRVRLFGDVQVEGCEPSALGRRQARTLLKILALHHGHPVALDTLIDCLWVDEPPALAADQISVLVSRLRRVVGADRIRRSDAGYRLTVDWLDLDAVADYAGEADRRLETGAVGGARAAASARVWP